VSDVINTAKPAAPAAPLRQRCPVLTKVPVGFLAAIVALIVIGLALGMAARGFHPMHLAATGIAWANM